MLEDNDILHLARGAYNIYNLQRDDPSAKVASVSRALSRLDMEVGVLLSTCCLGSLALLLCLNPIILSSTSGPTPSRSQGVHCGFTSTAVHL